MILIRDRDELKRHIDNLISMAEAEIRSPATGLGLASRVSGRIYGLKEAFEAIQAWEDFDRATALERSEDSNRAEA